MAENDQASEYVTIIEAARLFGISARTLTRWVEQGRLPCVVISGQPLVAWKDVETTRRRPTSDGDEGNETD